MSKNVINYTYLQVNTLDHMAQEQGGQRGLVRLQALQLL
jgi:hypothetical protein